MNDVMAERVRNSGFRATKQRVLLLSYLQRMKYPASIKEIGKALAKQRIDQATVYRMMEAFARAGLVREIAGMHNEPHYEFNDPANDHDHIVCSSCHKVEDLSGLHEKNVEQKALSKSRSFSTIQSHAFTLYGLCRSCVSV